MKRIEALARIVRQDQSPAAGLQVRLQVFGLAEGTWRDIARGAAEPTGDVRLGADMVQADDIPAPNLRLVRASDTAVLSDGGPLRYTKTTQVLSVDFGQIVEQPEAVVPTMLDARRFRGVTHSVAGISAPVGAAAAVTAQPQVAALNLRATQLESQVGDLGRENQQLRVQAVRAQELERANQQLDAQAKRVPELEKRVAETSQLNERLSRDAARVGDLDRENQQLRVQAVKAQELERTNQQLDAQARRVPELERRVAETSQLNERLSRDVARVGDLETRLGQTAQENARLKAEAARAAQLEKQLGDAQGQIEKLRAPTEKTVTMNVMATEIGSQIGRAQEQIRKEPGTLGLASVRVRVKGIVEGGGKVTLPGPAELAKPEVAAGLSDVDLAFEAQPAAPPPADDVQVPDLRRLTESAVRQVLHSIGLRLTAVKGPAGSGGVAAGQASLQAPSAGERAKRGATVTVVFAG